MAKSTEKKEKTKKEKTKDNPKNETPLKGEKKNQEEKEKTSYTAEELAEFKQIIEEKLERARKDLELLTDAFTNGSGNDISDTSPTFKNLEEGHQVLSKEENSRLAKRQEQFIRNLEYALIRIENKTYGICRETGKLISKERLRSVPHATLSIEAKLKQNK